LLTAEGAGNDFLGLVFGLPFAPEIWSPGTTPSPDQAIVSQLVLTYWSNFAYSG
jgi:hypothetical protein